MTSLDLRREGDEKYLYVSMETRDQVMAHTHVACHVVHTVGVLRCYAVAERRRGRRERVHMMIGCMHAHNIGSLLLLPCKQATPTCTCTSGSGHTCAGAACDPWTRP